MNLKPIADKRKTIMHSIIVLIVLVFGSSCGYYIYLREHRQLTALQNRAGALSGQLSNLKNQYMSLQAAGNIQTADWKTFCDAKPFYCFKYPSNWTVSKGYGYSTEPTGELSLQYITQNNHDGGSTTFMPHSVEDLNLGARTLKIVGGYYITSVGYQPFYAVADKADGLKLGQLSLWMDPTAFDLFQHVVPGYSELSVGYRGSNLTTHAQADAWFDSINGKTALTVIKSLYQHQ